MTLQWDDALPADQSGPRPQLLYRLKHGEQMSAVLLDRPHGVWLHWLAREGPKGRTRPCTGEGCIYCRPDLPKKHRSWCVSAALWIWAEGGQRRVWERRILELSEGVMVALGERAQRGVGITVSREGQSNRMTAVVHREGLDCLPARAGEVGQPLPEPHDEGEIRAALHHIWGLPIVDPGGPRQVLPWPKRRHG